MTSREAILNSIFEVPALPVSAVKALQLIQDPDSSMQEIMRAVELDPALTSDMLRLANSAYFAGPRQISTLREAGVLFGTWRLQQIILASAVFPLARKPLQGYGMPAGRLVDHLMAVAIGAEQLAKALKIKAPHFTFTAGILHDIGKIVLGTFVEIDSEPLMRLAFKQQVSFEIAEQRVLGIDHAEAGAALLEYWRIPEHIVTAVRWHHDPSSNPADSLVSDLVHASDAICIACGLGIGIEGLNYQISPEVAARLQLKPEVIEQVSAALLNEFQAMQSTDGGEADHTGK